MSSSTSPMTDLDLNQVLGVLERAQPADGVEQFYSSALGALRELVPCDDITFQIMDVQRRLLSGVCVTDEGVSYEIADGDPATSSRSPTCGGT